MSKETQFAVFCTESYKAQKRMSGAEVAKLFAKYDVYSYLCEFYDVLHTTGDQYINRDIDAYLQARGAATTI